MDNTEKMVWMDLEMTGLDPNHDTILEIATIVTNKNLDIIEMGPEIAIFESKEKLDSMSDWCQTHHRESGLVDRVLQSNYSVTKAETETLEFIKKHVAVGEAPLCGNSIHQDRRFLARYMENLNNYLHYRNIDVSTLKELFKRWYPEIPKFEKENQHTALEDTKESIAELVYYRDKMNVKM